MASASLREELGGKELTIEELLTQPFFLTEQDNYRRVLNRRLAAGGPSFTPSLECGDTSLLIRMLEIDRGVSFLAVVRSREQRKRGKADPFVGRGLLYFALPPDFQPQGRNGAHAKWMNLSAWQSWRTRKNKSI